MAIIKKQLLTVAVILLIILVAGCTNNSDEQIKQNNVNVDKDKIVVITKTQCPESREYLKPYLDRIKNEYGAEIKEYQFASPMDPTIDQILSENGLIRPAGVVKVLVCINENCFLGRNPITVELNKFMEQKK
jgi:hypothetical protein